MTIEEIITKHMQRYSVELQQKLEDYKTAIAKGMVPDMVVLLRHQVRVLEAKMDMLQELEEEMQQEGEQS